MEYRHPGWLISVKTVLTSIAAAFVIVSTLVGGCAWCIGLYSGLATRVTTLEINTGHMGDDLKDIKAMIVQMMGNSAGKRPDINRWVK